MTGDENANPAMKYPMKNFIPFLNHTLSAVKFHYTFDPDEARYMMILSTWLSLRDKKILPLLKAGYSKAPFSTINEYKALYNSYSSILKVRCLHH